jgi:hypothetical protein
LLFFGVVSLLRILIGSFLDGLSPKGGLMRLRYYSALKEWVPTMVISLGWLVIFFIATTLWPTSGPADVVIPFLFSCRYLLLSLIGLDICVRLLLIFRKQYYQPSESKDDIDESLLTMPGAVFAEWGFNYFQVLTSIAFVGILFLVCIGLFAIKIYPRIWFSLGGGQSRQVIFWFGPVSGTTSDSVLERDCSNPGYTIAYELLLENDNSLVLISPKPGRKAMIIDRKAVGTVILLGQRPSYAPANYRRGATEPPIFSQRCQNP